MMPSPGDQIHAWEQCPAAWPLTCSLDVDHMPMQWNERGFMQCHEVVNGEECGYIRYLNDIDPQILEFRHREGHRGCLEDLWLLI